jgi:hypothetical protein
MSLVTLLKAFRVSQDEGLEGRRRPQGLGGGFFEIHR